MNLKIWPNDVTTVVEKAAYVGMKVIAPAIYFFMQLSAWGVFHNIYQSHVAASGFGWHLFGFAFFLITVGWMIAVANDSKLVTKTELGNIIIGAVLCVTSLLGYGGFVF